MKYSSEKEDYASREEVITWVRQRLEELENEIRMLRSILAHYEEPGRISPDEKVEEVKMGRKRIAKVYVGEGYVRLIPEFEMPLPSDIKEYIEEVVNEIRERQAREGLEKEEQARLIIKERASGAVKELIIKNIDGITETIKAKAALKYAAELAWEIVKAKENKEE